MRQTFILSQSSTVLFARGTRSHANTRSFEIGQHSHHTAVSRRPNEDDLQGTQTRSTGRDIFVDRLLGVDSGRRLRELLDMSSRTSAFIQFLFFAYEKRYEQSCLHNHEVDRSVDVIHTTLRSVLPLVFATRNRCFSHYADMQVQSVIM